MGGDKLKIVRAGQAEKVQGLFAGWCFNIEKTTETYMPFGCCMYLQKMTTLKAAETVSFMQDNM